MIRIFFNYDNQVVQLPVNPGDLIVNTESNTKSMQMVELGEISILKGLKLKDFKFSSIFPNYDKYPFILTKGEFKEPQFYIDFFNKIMLDKKPCRLIVTDTSINMMVSIASFNYRLEAGDDDTIYDLQVREFREHRVKILQTQVTETTTTTPTADITSGSIANTETTVVQNSATASNSSRAVEVSAPQTYTIKSGDTLWKIAKSLLGDGNRWNDVYTYNNNKSVLGSNPNLIRVGKVISVPPTSYVGPKVKTTNKTTGVITNNTPKSNQPGAGTGSSGATGSGGGTR